MDNCASSVLYPSVHVEDEKFDEVEIAAQRFAARKDNRLLAIICMNFFAVSQIAGGVFFKEISSGVDVLVFTFLRNAFNLVGALVLCLIFRKRPLKEFPKSLRMPMLWRTVLGQFVFVGYMVGLMLNTLVV